jgi:hypothetical protein
MVHLQATASAIQPEATAPKSDNAQKSNQHLLLHFFDSQFYEQYVTTAHTGI